MYLNNSRDYKFQSCLIMAGVSYSRNAFPCITCIMSFNVGPIPHGTVHKKIVPQKFGLDIKNSRCAIDEQVAIRVM